MLNPEPATLADETITLAVPVFDNVTFFELLVPTVTFPNASADGENVNLPTGAAAPVPASDTKTAEPPALLAIEAEPLAAPTDCGWKTKDRVKLEPAVTV
jgi:hypothetical protein